MLRYLRIPAALVLLTLSACGFAEREGEGAGAAADSVTVPVSGPAVDSTGAPAADPRADSLPLDESPPIADAEEAADSGATAGQEPGPVADSGAVEGAQPAGGAATGAQSPESAEDMLERGAAQVRHWGLRIVVSILFLVFVSFVIRGVVWVLDRLAESNAKRRLFYKRLVPISRIFLWALAFPFAALVILDIDTQGLVAAGAAVGVAVGFAAQDILKNIFGGIIVLFDQPFQVGDKISIGGTYGEVVSIGLRSTRIVTPDDNLVTVPNAQVVGDQVANANAGELNCQVVTDLYLPGWADEAHAKRLAFEAATSSKYVYLNKPVVVLVKDEFKETFLLHLKVKAYVLDPRHEFLFMSDVTERARAAFREAGLLGPMHGVRAWVDLDRFGRTTAPPEADGSGEDR